MFFTFRVDKDITVSLISDKTKICILLLKNTKFSTRSGSNPKSFFLGWTFGHRWPTKDICHRPPHDFGPRDAPVV